MDYLPSELGWDTRWKLGTTADNRLSPEAARLPSLESVVVGSTLHLDGSTVPLGLTYQHRDLETKTLDPIVDRLGYNGGYRRVALPVFDFCVSFELTIEEATPGAALGIGLVDRTHRLEAELPLGQRAPGEDHAMLRHDALPQVAMPSAPIELLPRSVHQVSLAFVDQQAFLEIDGNLVVDAWAIPKNFSRNDKLLGTAEPLQLGVRGAKVTLKHLVLYRDIYYRSEDEDLKHAVTRDLPLGADEYFMLGDNSASSSDSRMWATPGVERSRFLGKPFLIHQPLTLKEVPGLGRVQSFDWARFRFLR
jgi:signal peptidase I